MLKRADFLHGTRGRSSLGILLSLQHVPDAVDLLTQKVAL
jgi:hypothetical protein